MLFGKPASVEKWITAATENESFATRAEDGGYVFVTTNRLAETPGGIALTSTHETKALGFVANVMMTPMIFFKGMLKKAILQDLADIKAAVEKR